MTLILELHDGKEAALKAKAQARGVSAEEYASQLLDHDLEEEATPATPWPGLPIYGAGLPVEARDSRPIWEVILDNMKDVPPEDLAALPKDGASQVDHYIYGLPKRDQ